MTVVVQGTGTANARPDRAVLLFELGHTAPTSPEALRNVAQRTASLEALLRDRGVADADWTTAGVTVHRPTSGAGTSMSCWGSER